jgi:DNA-binding PadR family transcriptional regulator
MEIKGHLKIIVLKLLEKQNLTGYGIINEINTKTGFWKPSPGSIYPLMNELHKKGLVGIKKEKNQKIYSITERGRIVLKKLVNEKNKAIENIKEHISILQLIEEKKNIKPLLEMINMFKEDQLFCKDNIADFIMLRFEVLDAIKNKKNIKEVNNIIKEASQKIKKL